MGKFTKEMVDDYADKLMIGLTEEENKMVLEEFDIIAKDLNYGLDLTTVFSRFYDRVKVDEIKYITSSLSLLNKTGGNIVSVFNMIEKHFYDKTADEKYQGI